jgi:hypothetical protein
VHAPELGEHGLALRPSAANRVADGLREVERRLLLEVSRRAGPAAAIRSPASNSSRPARMRISVVLPHPFGPTSRRARLADRERDAGEDHALVELLPDVLEREQRHPSSILAGAPR